MTQKMVAQVYRYPLIQGNGYYLALLFGVMALFVQLCKNGHYLLAINLIPPMVVLVVITYARKFMAEYLKLHYEGIEFEYDSQHLEIRIVNLVSWFDWFQVPGLKSVPVPLELIYKQFPWTQTGKMAYQSRLALERWVERTRLFLVVIGEVKVDIRKPQINEYPIRVSITDLRQHLPLETAQHSKEQLELYPYGYPNLVEPIYEIYKKVSLLSAPVMAFCTRYVTIAIHRVEVHNLPNPASVNFVLNEGDEKQSVNPVRRLLNEASENLKQPDGGTKRSDKDHLTVLVNDVNVSFKMEFKDKVFIDVFGITVHEGRNYVLNGATANAAATVNACSMVLQMKDFDPYVSQGIQQDKRTVLLAQDHVMKNRMLSMHIQVASKPPYHVSSEYMDELVKTTKTTFIRKFKPDSESTSLMESTIPLIGRLWEDSGLSHFARSSFSKTISSLAKKGGEMSVQDDINVMW